MEAQQLSDKANPGQREDRIAKNINDTYRKEISDIYMRLKYCILLAICLPVAFLLVIISPTLLPIALLLVIPGVLGGCGIVLCFAFWGGAGIDRQMDREWYGISDSD